MPLTAPQKPGKDADRIRGMFADIAGRYDFLNRLLSARTDVAWRNLVVREALRPGDRLIVDLACGTGDLAFALRAKANSSCRVLGIDFTGPMLRVAQGKERRAAPGPVTWIEGDGLNLPLESETVDLLTIAFGIRNMESLERAFAEIHRVLRPGGRLAVLEFSQPENRLVQALYYPYFLHVLPRLGALISNQSAYLYLPHSVLHFPGRKDLARIMKRGGFRRVRHCALSFGIAALHVGEKPGGTS